MVQTMVVTDFQVVPVTVVQVLAAALFVFVEGTNVVSVMVAGPVVATEAYLESACPTVETVNAEVTSAEPGLREVKKISQRIQMLAEKPAMESLPSKEAHDGSTWTCLSMEVHRFPTVLS